MKSIYSTRSQIANGVYTTRHFKDKVLKVQTLVSYNGKQIDVDKLIESGNLSEITDQLGDAINEHTQQLTDLSNDIIQLDDRVAVLENVKTLHETQISEHTERLTTLENNNAVKYPTATGLVINDQSDFNTALTYWGSSSTLQMGINNNRKSLIKVIDNVNNHLERIVALESNSGSGDCLEQSIDIQPFKGITSEDWEKAKEAGEILPETQDQVVSMSATNALQSSVESTMAAAFRVKFNHEPRILALESNSNSITETTIIQRSNTMSNGKYEFYSSGDKDFTVSTIDDLAYIMDQNDTVTYMVVNSNTERIKSLETDITTLKTQNDYPEEGIRYGFEKTATDMYGKVVYTENSNITFITSISDLFSKLTQQMTYDRNVIKSLLTRTNTLETDVTTLENNPTQDQTTIGFNFDGIGIKDGLPTIKSYSYNTSHSTVNLEDALLSFMNVTLNSLKDLTDMISNLHSLGIDFAIYNCSK